MYYEEDQEPELEGLRNLSVSTDGTIDTLDENPTPPHSSTPVVHITPPGAKLHLDSSDPRLVSFEGDIFDRVLDSRGKKPALEPIDPLLRPRSPFLGSFPSYSEVPPTPPAVKLAFPCLPSNPTPTPVSETLAERRASLGKLSNKALLSLQQMRFESSDEAGMGLGVGPPSVGLEGFDGVSRGKQTGKMFQLAMGLDDGEDCPVSRDGTPSYSNDSDTLLLAASGVDKAGHSLCNFGSSGSLRRTRSLSSISSADGSFSIQSSGSPSIQSSSSPRPPPSPMVQRSSAFVSSNGPLTPLTPSHIPGAPSLGTNSGSAFEYFSFSAPESPVSPTFKPAQQKLPQLDRFASQPTLPLTPTSDSGSITPTGPCHSTLSSKRASSRSRLPASPLGRGIFDEESASTFDNPFFAT